MLLRCPGHEDLLDMLGEVWPRGREGPDQNPTVCHGPGRIISSGDAVNHNSKCPLHVASSWHGR
jgi:hypothetical protein